MLRGRRALVKLAYSTAFSRLTTITRSCKSFPRKIICNRCSGAIFFAETLVVAPRRAFPAISVAMNSRGRLIPTCCCDGVSPLGAVQRASGEVGLCHE
ncbi:hypothetical protein V6N13_063652 [Hibiscus sabdariffa]